MNREASRATERRAAPACDRAASQEGVCSCPFGAACCSCCTAVRGRLAWRAGGLRSLHSVDVALHRASCAWHRRAAQAKLHLGKCYRDGKGTAVDERLAREVRRAAAARSMRPTACGVAAAA
jgi:hypothetical protein